MVIFLQIQRDRVQHIIRYNNGLSLASIIIDKLRISLPERHSKYQEIEAENEVSSLRQGEWVVDKCWWTDITVTVSWTFNMNNWFSDQDDLNHGILDAWII